MYPDRLNGLLALKVVAEKRNFTAAAKTLGISPSAVSQAIKQIEQRLGVALLSRTTRSTSLTEAGERFLHQAGPALDQILGALEDVGTYAEKPAGLLRLNLPRQIYPCYLAPLITSFIKKNPDVTVELFFEDQSSDIVEKGFDAGVRISDILAKDVVAIKLLGPVRFVTAGSPNYFDRMGRPKHPKDLLSHNCIRSRLGPVVYDRWEYEHKGKELQVPSGFGW
jgi:DNA-binding transcriptional LysR family regulator